MRKEDLELGHEYRVVLHGVPINARLLSYGYWGTDHQVEITSVPAKHPKMHKTLHKVGARTNVASVSIKHAITFVIKEEE